MNFTDKRLFGNYFPISLIKFFALDDEGDFWYNRYSIINMGGAQNAIKKAVDIMGFECAQ